MMMMMMMMGKSVENSQTLHVKNCLKMHKTINKTMQSHFDQYPLATGYQPWMTTSSNTI
jgi:hypothetical protein